MTPLLYPKFGIRKYQAFTDLIWFNDAFYCSFREAKNYVGAENNGKVRILRSKDGNDCQSVALLELNGSDLPDPKLSIALDKRLMIALAGTVFENGLAKVQVPMSSFSDKIGRIIHFLLKHLSIL